MDLLILESEYLAFSKHFKSTGTYRYDKSHLPTIINFLQDSGYTDTSQLDFEALYLFIDQSRIHDNSNATINKRISLLNRSIAFQVKQGKCEPTIIASFPKLKEIDKRYSIIDEATMRKVIAYLLEDLPLPADAEIVKAPTVLLGTGESISGRIILTSNYSPAENLIFYGTETLSTGWSLVSSKVGEEVTLVYAKNGRFATIYLSPKETFQSFH